MRLSVFLECPLMGKFTVRANESANKQKQPRKETRVEEQLYCYSTAQDQLNIGLKAYPPTCGFSFIFHFVCKLSDGVSKLPDFTHQGSVTYRKNIIWTRFWANCWVKTVCWKKEKFSENSASLIDFWRVKTILNGIESRSLNVLRFSKMNSDYMEAAITPEHFYKIRRIIMFSMRMKVLDSAI